MKTITLLILTGLFSLGGSCTSKLNSNHLSKNQETGFPFFFAINSVAACCFFLIEGGFRLSVNLPTLLYSVLYAGVVVLAIFSNLKALQAAEISNVNVASGAGTLLLTSAVGFLFFRESLTLTKALRILLMLAGTLLIFLERRTKKGVRRGFLPALLGVLAASLANTLVLKFYANTPNVADDSSFFFWTNAVLLFAALLWLMLRQLRSPVSLKEYSFLLKPRCLIPFVGNTVCSNVGSLLSLQLVARLDISILSPLTGAIGCTVNLLASLIFKEKLGICSYLAAALALIAVII